MLDVVIVQPDYGEPGGVTADVVNLVTGLESRGQRAHTAKTLGQLRHLLRSRPAPLVHVFGCLPSATTFGSLALARLYRLPLVWTRSSIQSEGTPGPAMDCFA